jgi:hypothetical protein
LLTSLFIVLGEALDALSRRSYPILKVEPLEEPERRSFIRNYLNKISKKLTDDQVWLFSNYIRANIIHH